MKTLFAIVLTLGLMAASGFAQPAITGVQNAASNAVNPPQGTAKGDCQCSALPNAAIAQGSYFAVYGSGFGPSAPALWDPYPLPTTLGGVTASVTVSGTTVPVYIEFAANFGTYSQINAVLPSNTPLGTGTITVSYGGATSAAWPITVVASSFGTFSVNEAGTGPGIFTEAYNATLKTTPNTEITPFSTTAPGDYVTIWGTGLGAVNASTEGSGPPMQTNLCATAASCPVTVWVAGLQAQITYAGRSPYTAEDQIDFIVPPGVQGCYVQVAVQTGAIVGNFTSISVDPTGPTCQDADGINYGDLAAVLQTKSTVNVGAISMLSNYLTLDIPALGATLQWDNDTVSGEIGTYSPYVLTVFQGYTLAPSVGNCTVQPFSQYPPPLDPGLALINFLDAGASLGIAGPNGSATVKKNANGKGYSGLVGGATINELITESSPPPPFFLNSSFGISSGNYTVTGTGGADVGALSAAISVSSSAAAFSWTNESTVTAGAIPRDTPLTITWTGGDTNGFVDITAISSTLQTGSTPQTNTPGILVECIAPASAGTFTVPTYVLQSLPSTVGSTALVPPGELLVGPASAAATTPTASLPSGLDALYIFYPFIQGANVTWQ